MPTIKELSALIRAIKGEISPEYRAFEDDDQPGIQLTIACSEDGSEWTYQTGDNSYAGSCYFYAHWAVAGVYRTTNSRDLARAMIADLEELRAE
jgi:hypothetical protein